MDRQARSVGDDSSCCAESGLSPLALGLFFEPVGNIACDNDGPGNHHRGCGEDAGANNEGDAGFIGTAMDGRHLDFLQDHVVGHPLALGVEDLRRSGYIHTALQDNGEAEGKAEGEGERGQLQDSILQHGVIFCALPQCVPQNLRNSTVSVKPVPPVPRFAHISCRSSFMSHRRSKRRCQEKAIERRRPDGVEHAKKQKTGQAATLAVTSISTSAPSGKRDTSTHDRAGNALGKYRA